MKKIFVLDTNILLNDPHSIFSFEDNDIVIPLTCIEEIDKFKRDQNERGRNARAVSRILDQLRVENEKSLAEGIKFDQGGTLRIELGWEASQNYPYRNGLMSNDDRILAIALSLKRRYKRKPVVLLTRDTNLRIRADAMGLSTEDYNSDHVNIETLYPGILEIFVTGNIIDQLYQEKELQIDKELELYSNQYILFKNEESPSHTGIGRVVDEVNHIVACCQSPQNIWGIQPRNLEQRIALDLLLNDQIPLVTLVGRAGTGKTLMALAAGLAKSVDEQAYRKLLVSRPVFPMGRDLGFLPGEIKDKLKPWMQPIFDNLEMLLDGDGRKGKSQFRSGAIDLMEQGMLEVEPLTYIRGRSIPNQYFVVDEAQNLTPHEIKTIVSRAGYNTKIVLTGDPFQIDNPYLDSESTGIIHLVERFKGSILAGHITLRKGERSQLAQAATERL